MTTISWVMPWGQLSWLRACDEKLARQFFNVPTSYVVGNSKFPNPTNPWGCQVMPVFYSFEAYASAGATQTGQAFPWVCYDPENWPATDPKVKRHPEAAFWHFVMLANARGQKVVAAPSRDLVYTPNGDNVWQPGETINEAYIRCQIPSSGEDADVLLVQNQGAEKDLQTYGWMLVAANKQSPVEQGLWAGLTTNFATGAQMKAAYDAAMYCGVPVVGFWLTIASQAQASVCADFLRLL